MANGRLSAVRVCPAWSVADNSILKGNYRGIGGQRRFSKGRRGTMPTDRVGAASGNGAARAELSVADADPGIGTEAAEVRGLLHQLQARRRWQVASIRLHPDRYRELKAYFVDLATHRTAERLWLESEALRVVPYAPIGRQCLDILRAVNRARSGAGFEPLPTSVGILDIMLPSDNPKPSEAVAQADGTTGDGF